MNVMLNQICVGIGILGQDVSFLLVSVVYAVIAWL